MFELQCVGFCYKDGLVPQAGVAQRQRHFHNTRLSSRNHSYYYYYYSCFVLVLFFIIFAFTEGRKKSIAVQKGIALTGNETLNLHYRCDASDFEIYLFFFFFNLPFSRSARNVQ